MNEFAQQHPTQSTLLVVAACFVWVIFLSWVTSVVGGWRSLAERYRTDREFPPHRRRMQSASMRSGISINHALTLASDSTGIYMGLTLPILFGFPRLFIPWADIQVKQPRNFLFLRLQRLLLGPDAVPLRIRESTAQFLLEPLGETNPAATGTISSSFSS